MSPVFLSCFSSFHLLSANIRRFTRLTLHCIKFVRIDNNFPTQRLTQRSWWPHPRPHWPALYIPHPGDKPWRWTGHVNSWSVLLQWLKDGVNFVQIKGGKWKKFFEFFLSNDQCLTLDAKIARMNALSSEDNSPPYLCRSTHWILHGRSETELEALVGREGSLHCKVRSVANHNTGSYL